MDNPVVATPLEASSFDTDGLSVTEEVLINKINLRGEFESPDVNKALADLVGMKCDLAPNTFVSNGAVSLFWLGPNERLLYTASAPQVVIEQWKQQSSTAAVDVTDYYTVLRLTGAKTRDVIASGSPFDVHADVFSAGQCAQTRFGNASVLMANHAETPVFTLQVRWSFATYVYEYIKRVAGYV